MPVPTPEDFLTGEAKRKREFSRNIGEDWNIRQVGANLVGTYKPTGANHILAGSGVPFKITTAQFVSGGGSTTSTSFVDYPGPIDLSVTKEITNSVLVVQGAVGMFNSSAGALQAIWGVRINSVDYEICAFFFNQVNVHLQLYGANGLVASGLAAGTYTMRVRWRSPGGGSINSDSNDRVLYTVTERAL